MALPFMRMREALPAYSYLTLLVRFHLDLDLQFDLHLRIHLHLGLDLDSIIMHTHAKSYAHNIIVCSAWGMCSTSSSYCL